MSSSFAAPAALALGWYPGRTWDWLQSSPLFWVTLTLATYLAGRWLLARTRNVVFQPVLVSIVLVGAVLLVTGTDYQDYLRGGSLIAFLLGPATVALALPLHQEWHLVRRAAVPILSGVVLGAVVSIVSVWFVAGALGADRAMQLTMAPKATTTPVSIVISAEIGGIPALTAVITITTGILSAVIGPWVLDRFGIRDQRARGLAIGAVSHGIGTSRALQESRVEGAFSALAMGLTTIATSILVPLLVLVL